MWSTRASLRSSVTLWGTLLARAHGAPEHSCSAFSVSNSLQAIRVCPSRSLVSCNASEKDASLLRQRSLFSVNSASQLPWLHLAKRHMAKGKDRKKEKKSDKPKVMLDDDDMEKVMAFDDFKLEVEAIIDNFKNDLKLNYNVRINPRQIEILEITYDGIKVALADIVTIARKQQELVINLAATPNALKPTMNAILESGLNLNPQQDGHIIYIRMPKVTTEHRQVLIKSVKAAGQKAKDMIKDRNFHKKFYHKGAEAKKLSQDLQNDVIANLNFFIKQKCFLIDEITNQKAESLLNN